MASFVKSKIKAAREAIGKKDWAAAENNALQALEYEPDNYHGNVFLGLASVELGNNKQSEAAYRKAIVSSPEQVLAWQGLSKYYERVGDWKDYAETLVKMMDLHAKANDATKCAEALQKLIDVRRSRGTSEELYDTLLLLLPSSSYYNVLSSLPPPEPTAPTSTTTYAIQSAIQNSLPILEELVSMEEKREERFINSEVDKRRMRLNALPLPQLKAEVTKEAFSISKLPELYEEIINHPQTSDALRRATERRLLRHRHAHLISLQVSEATRSLKDKLRAQVDDMIDGAILLKIADPLPWTIYIEGLDCEELDGYDTSILRQFLALLPDEPLAQMVRGYLTYIGEPTVEEDEEEGKKREQEKQEEDPTILITGAFPDNQDTIFAHRVMGKVCLDTEDYDQARKIGESGLSLVRRSENQYGRKLSLTRGFFTICIAIALVHLFPPKHHLRAAGLLDEVLDDDPNNIVCLMGRATVYQYAEKWKEAEALYLKVESLKGENDLDDGLEAREQRVWCRMMGGQLEDGTREMKVVLDILDSLDGKERQKARAWWRLGRAYWEAGGDTRKTAFTHWITALKRLPTFAPAFTSLGIHYLEEASPPDHVRASKCFQKAFELDPREGEAARRLAEGFADEKEWDLVEVVASRTIAGEGGVSGGLDDSEGAAAKRNFVPTNAWAWKAMGVVELNRHNYDKAIIALQLTVRANDDDFQSWLRLGEAYAYGGRHVAALKALNRARELSPDDWTCIYVQGDVWRLIYQYDQAIEAFETVLEMRPGDAGVRIALAGTHLEHGNEEHSTGFLQRAEVSFRTAVEIAAGVIKDASGFGGMAWKIIGDGLYQLSKKTTFGDPEGVMQTLSSLLELVASRTQDDSDNPASEKLALAIAQLGEGIINGDVALAFSWAAYQTRLSVVEGDEVVASASFDVAVVLKRMATTLDEEGTKKLLEQAKVLVKTAIRANSMAAVYWNTLGALYFEDDASLAQHAFIMAIEVDKKNPAPWTNLGLLYLHHNDLELANHAFYRAQVLDPDYSLAWVGQAIVASRNNHNVEARALLEHAVGLSANIPEADLEFASRMFKLYTGPQTPGETRSTETLFLPFAVLDRYCQQRPDDATALHLYGLICERLGLNDLAIELVEKAIVVLDAAYNEKEDPETERRYAVAHIALGRLRLASSGFNGASEAYHVALSLLPVGEDETSTVLRAHAHYGSGVAAYKMDDLAKALEILENAMAELPEQFVDVRGHLTLALAQILWAVGSDEAKETGKSQLFAAITDNPKNLDAITALAAYGILTLDDELVDAALSEMLGMMVEERQKLDPERKVEELLVHNHLINGRTREAEAILEAAVHKEPMRPSARQQLAQLLIQQGKPDKARSVLAGLAASQESSERSSLVETLRLSALALIQTSGGDKDGRQTALREAQRAVFLGPPSLESWDVLDLCRS